MKRLVVLALLLTLLIVAVVIKSSGQPPSHLPDRDHPAEATPEGTGVELPPGPEIDPGGSAEQPPQPGALPLVLRNLADESVLADFELGLHKASPTYGPLQWISDGSGSLIVPEALLGELTPTSRTWQVAGIVRPGDGSATLWLYESMEVDVTVTVEGPGPKCTLSEVRLWADILKDLGPLGDKTTRPPYTKSWMRNSGVLPLKDLPRPDANGRVRCSVPAIKGLTLSAHLNGWRPDHAAVPTTEPRSGAPAITLQLTRQTLDVSGRLVDEDGKPVCNIPVVLYVTRRMPIAEMMSDEEIRRFGHAYTATVSEQKGYARVTWRISTRSASPDSESPGGFTLRSNVEGDALLVVMPDDRWVLERRSLGNLGEDMPSQPITLKGAVGMPDVKFTRGGEALNDFSVLIVDLSAGDAQPAFKVKGKPDGTIGTSNLETGRRYHVVVFFEEEGNKSVRSGPVTWSGQKVLDVLDLD